MLDDFSALDLLSIGGFRLSSAPPSAPAKKKRFMGHRRGSNASARRGFAAFLPLFGGRIRRPVYFRVLQGWPVALSWPTREFSTPDLGTDPFDRPSA